MLALLGSIPNLSAVAAFDHPHVRRQSFVDGHFRIDPDEPVGCVLLLRLAEEPLLGALLEHTGGLCLSETGLLVSGLPRALLGWGTLRSSLVSDHFSESRLAGGESKLYWLLRLLLGFPFRDWRLLL